MEETLPECGELEVKEIKPGYPTPSHTLEIGVSSPGYATLPHARYGPSECRHGLSHIDIEGYGVYSAAWK